MIKSRWFANCCLILVTLVWGGTFTLTKGALTQVTPIAFLTVRFLVASVFLVVIAILTPGRRGKFQKRTWWLGSLLGIFLYGAYALQTYGLKYTTPAKAGFLTGLFVVLVPMLGTFVLRKRLMPRMWYGAFLAVTGLGLLCGGEIVRLAPGDVLELLCAVFVALQMLYIEKYGGNTDPLALATAEILVLTICCLLTALCITPVSTWHVGVWMQPTVFWAVLICAVPGTAVAYWAQNIFQKHTTSAQAAVIFSMEPVFSWFIAWVALGETLTLYGSIGSLLILLSMIVADPSIRLQRHPLSSH